ncbi:MAG: hypothetical protein ACPHN2_05840 [Sinimarinibacterium flocculans]|uniref:hypothetical protein n=1 Tax=Sinimarinibacterium flocculans TaxID=985250 RepID=UPI002E9F7ECB|nr:hypothetical protein [Pseudomonadota bacterium]
MQIQTNKAKRIPIFEDLFAHYPRCAYLAMRNTRVLETARSVFKPGFRNHYLVLHSSRLNDGIVQCESGLEAKICSLMEGLPHIASYRSQPAALQIRIAGRKQTVFPDLLAIDGTGNVTYIDVKPHRHTLTDSFLARSEGMTAYTAEIGGAYQILTEKDLNSPRNKNVSTFLSRCNGIVRRPLAELTWHWLGTLPTTTTINEALNTLDPYPAAQSALCGWILDGEVIADLDSTEGTLHQTFQQTAQHGRRVRYAPE